jgi:hypothetical protein
MKFDLVLSRKSHAQRLRSLQVTELGICFMYIKSEVLLEFESRLKLNTTSNRECAVMQGQGIEVYLNYMQLEFVPACMMEF